MFHPETGPRGQNRAPNRRAALTFAILAIFSFVPVAAVAVDTPSGLPVPRFVTTRSSPINVRVGPGTRYDIAWVYVKAGVPVEIVQEFDTWRKVRDIDGSTGWLHQNLLTGKRAAIVHPADSTVDRVALRAKPQEDADPVAWLTPGYQVELKACDRTWCRAVAHANGDGGNRAYDGYLPQALLWGVRADESFD